MTKPILGKHLLQKKVVSSSGLELGEVLDIYFQTDGTLSNLIVKPDHEMKELKDHLNKHGLLDIPFSEVKAVGRYVIVNFPY